MDNKAWRDSFTVLVTLAGQPGSRRSTFILFFGISLRAAHTVSAERAQRGRGTLSAALFVQPITLCNGEGECSGAA